MLEDAGARRVAKFLDDFDKKFSGLSSSVPDASILKEEGVLPLPSFMLNHTSLDRDDPMDVDSKSPVDDQCDKDSGLGSSISGSKQERRSLRSSTRRSVKSCATSDSAVTRSFSALGTQNEATHALSRWAEEQIQKRIVKPILKEEALKEFHPLLKDVPRKIGDKQITNLRDLEKTLIFLAPNYCASPKSYLEFCETSIQCIHTTVDYLSESDQRRPSDRPYTNHYFLDLVEQIRRYAAIMAATREKEARGEELDEMDYSPSEKITLRSGLSHDGKPVELVREKDGKVIPIAEGSSSSMMSPPKRPLTEEEMDSEEVRRSMARRRKSDKPGDVMHQCRDCGKEFKRPCDLTKHEKTHSRPWKCPEAKCKFHDLGWPTEKERDRHVNDKHSATPPQYKCLWANCTYASKRESNCKQHMEKAHGYNYVRSKSNGRKKNNNNSNSLTPQTPVTPLINTPTSALQSISTPVTPSDNSPFGNSYNDFDFNAPTMNFNYGTPAISTENLANHYRRGSDTTAGSAMTWSSSHSPNQPLPPNSFEEAITPEESEFNPNMDMNSLNINFDYGSTTFQQPTPALSTSNVGGFADLSFNQPINTDLSANNAIPHLSPGAQGDMTLFSPPMASMQIDEGFGDDNFSSDNFVPPQGQDFMLFESGSNTTSWANTTTGAQLFPELNNSINANDQFNSMYPSMEADIDNLLGFTQP